MLQSFEIWCENCVKTTYYENEKILMMKILLKLIMVFFARVALIKLLTINNILLNSDYKYG